jgi:hypothetical protein
MSKHRMPRRRSPLNRTVGVGVVAGGIALGAVGLLAPATASADISVGGQSDSPGAAGGNMGGSTASNNVFTGGTGSVTVVNQTNGNYTGGDGNTSVHIPFTVNRPTTPPNFRWGGQRNSPGAAGGNMGGSAGSGNVVNFRGLFTQVTANNGNYAGGANNTSIHIPIEIPAVP